MSHRAVPGANVEPIPETTGATYDFRPVDIARGKLKNFVVEYQVTKKRFQGGTAGAPEWVAHGGH